MRGVDRRLTRRVLRAVDEADEIAVVEIAEAMHFVDGRDRVAEPRHDLRRQLEAEVHALGADVEQEIARRGDRMARSGADLAERMQLRRPRRAEQPVPGVRADAHDAGEISLEVAEADGADNAERSAQNDRTAARLAAPGFTVATRKIAARVST